MAEYQFFPSTPQGGVPVLVNGVEVQNSDLAFIGQVAGLADDRVFSELIRTSPVVSGGTVVRGVLPFGTRDANEAGFIVRPSRSANGSVAIWPFRAIIGQRVAVTTDAKNGWQDIRSAAWFPPTNAWATLGTSLSTSNPYLVPLAANSSGNPRWDLIYASFAIDQAGNQVQRRVKDPNASNPTVQAVSQYLTQAVTIQVAQGSPASTPALPSLPADSGSTYNIPLAYVRVVNGFSSTTTVSPGDVRDCSLVLAPDLASGVATCLPANGNNDGAGTYATNFAWPAATSNSRPSVFVPPGMAGVTERFMLIDLRTSGRESHPNGSVIDNSLNWNHRYFKVDYEICNPGSGPPNFGSDASASSVLTLPFPVASTGGVYQGTQMSNSFTYSPDNTAGANTNLIMSHLHGTDASNILPSGAAVGIYADSAGALRMYFTGTPGCLIVVWLRATNRYAQTYI